MTKRKLAEHQHAYIPLLTDKAQGSVLYQKCLGSGVLQIDSHFSLKSGAIALITDHVARGLRNRPVYSNFPSSSLSW